MSSSESASLPVSAGADDGARWSGTLLLAAFVGVAIGALTAYAERWLTDGLGSLANSAGPWSLAAFLVAMCALRAVPGALSASLTLGACELGYVIANHVRGGSSATSTIVFWLAAATLAGPPLGVAGVWTRRSGRWFEASLGPAVLAGVFIGEPTYALSTIAETTTTAYWITELLIGVAIVVAACVRIIRRDLGPRLAPAACAAATITVAVVVASAARLA